MIRSVDELWRYLQEDNFYFIAEAGVNHLGDLDLAEKLIKSAAKSGCDSIKFQSYKASELCIKNAPRFWDSKDFEGFEEEDEDGSQHDSYSILDSFGKKEHLLMSQMCDENNIEFMSTPFDKNAVDYLNEITINSYKVASCDITNFPFLEYIAKKNKIVMLSTGASTMKEVKEAVELVSKYNDKIVIMHCSLHYPSSNDEANLGMILDLKKEFGDKYIIGLSDHTTDLHTSAFAYMLGARVFERHFTVEEGRKRGKSPDHYFGVLPEEIYEMIKITKIAESMMGSNIKDYHSGEELARKYARRSIVTIKDIKPGEKFTEYNIGCKRPGTGISPKMFYDVIGKTANTHINNDVILLESDIVEEIDFESYT
jgi:sialic acid synthase SpsE